MGADGRVVPVAEIVCCANCSREFYILGELDGIRVTENMILAFCNDECNNAYMKNNHIGSP